jgi:hypothetical protein
MHPCIARQRDTGRDGPHRKGGYLLKKAEIRLAR